MYSWTTENHPSETHVDGCSHPFTFGISMTFPVALDNSPGWYPRSPPVVAGRQWHVFFMSTWGSCLVTLQGSHPGYPPVMALLVMARFLCENMWTYVKMMTCYSRFSDRPIWSSFVLDYPWKAIRWFNICKHLVQRNVNISAVVSQDPLPGSGTIAETRLFSQIILTERSFGELSFVLAELQSPSITHGLWYTKNDYKINR